MTRAQLDYAPAAPIRRRKRIRRAATLFGTIVLTISALRFGPRALDQSRMLYYQRACLRFDAPSDRIVFDEQPGDLLKQTNYVSMRSSAGPAALYVAPPLAKLSGDIPVIGTPGATVFLHELKTKSGQSRLVCVRRLPVLVMAPQFDYPLGLEAFIFEPGGWRSMPRSLLPPGGGICEPPSKDLRIYAGQLDPNDPSHFTIRYLLNKREGMIDGRLDERGDELTMEIRDRQNDDDR